MMKLFPSQRETIGGVSAALRSGETTCAEVLKGCVAKLDQWERRVRAWVHLDLQGAEAEARQLDQELAEGCFRGPLHGIPIGIKDIIGVAGMPTACGSRLWKDRIAEQDARVVTELRKAGAVILGKTVTTAYAWIDPPVTRNPWNLERTPGGSSSGSAAAVATGMCLGAIGTQTGGSIIRPASFCGVAGFKPTFQRSFFQGILPFAQSLDHVGPIARTVEDLAFLLRTMSNNQEAENVDVDAEASEGYEQETDAHTIALLAGPFWDRADSSVKMTFNSAIQAFQAAGATIIPPSGGVDFDRIVLCHRTIMASEAAANHQERLRRAPADYPDRIRSLIEEGTRISANDYIQAKWLQEGTRELEGRYTRVELDPLIRLLGRMDVDCVATPATLGPAPDLSTTGDPAFNSPWSFLGLPTVTFPMGVSPEKLPLGIQLIGTHRSDFRLLDTAEWCERVIRDALSKRGD